MSTRPKIVLLGMLTKIPVAGVAWLIGQYATGFERLGCEPYYVEAHGRTPSMFMADADDDPTATAVSFLAATMARFGLARRWAFHALHRGGACYGMSERELRRLYRDADLIINMHGGTKPLAEHVETGRLLYLGTDPVQLELELHAGDRQAIDFLEQHAAYFTWALNHGNPDCLLPWSHDHPFVPSPPPVVVDLWPDEPPPHQAPFTTIGNWRQEWREVEFQGERYHWSKHREFLKFVDLPARHPARYELALGSFVDRDRQLLEHHGWSVRPAAGISTDLDAYRAYIGHSRAEFTVAKDQNVRLRTGWFSERTASYLASGRPAVMQDTGFGNAIPAGEGLFPFRDLDGAIEAVAQVEADYERHRRAARDIAREYFNYDVVLTSMLDTVGLGAPRRSIAEVPARSPAPAELPKSLRLVPVSRRPLVLDPATVEHVAHRPVPGARRAAGPDPVASVVVATVDNLVVCRLALESVLAHTTVPFELVVVDNGSQDDTRQYLEVLAARNANVQLVRNGSNRGFAAASNQGLALARGETMVLLNDDTIVTPGWLEGLLACTSDSAVGLVGPTSNRCGNEAEVPADYETYGELLEFAAARTRLMGSADGGAPGAQFDIPVAVMFCVAMRRDVVERVGTLDERFDLGLFEDDDYSRRVRQAGLRVTCAEGAFVHHFGEATLGRIAGAGGYGELFHRNRRRFDEKWGVRWQSHDRRVDPAYTALRSSLRDAIGAQVPHGSVVLVISRGDDDLLDVPAGEGWHFPCTPEGAFAGHYPADDAAAIAHLEALRARGARWLAVPATSLWWLDYYTGFRLHLERHYRVATQVAGTGIVYALDDDRVPMESEGSVA